MSLENASELSKALNQHARSKYNEVAKRLAIDGLTARWFPRLHLRHYTPYPYRLVSDNTFYPSGKPSFGRVIHASRAEGLSEIHKTIGDQTAERNWLHIEQINQWVDTTLETGEYNVEPDQFAHIFLSHMFPKVETLHTHPDQLLRRLHLAQGDILDPLLQAALPSNTDIVHFFQMRARVANPRELASTIVSHYGATTITAPNFEGGAVIRTRPRPVVEDGPDVHANILRALGEMSSDTITHDNKYPLSLSFEAITP